MMAPQKKSGLSLDDIALPQASAKKTVKVEHGAEAPALSSEEPRKDAHRLNGSGDDIRSLRRTNQKSTAAPSFSVILDAPTKDRLERAAFENKVKMTAIVRAAIDKFLRENGY